MSAAESTAYCPCHITGFFFIHDRYKDPSRIGSTGVGVTVEQGVITRVSIRKAPREKISIALNDRLLKTPSVSTRVVREYVNLTKTTWNITASHSCRLPVGTGYGTSGAGALGLSLALNEAMGDPVSRLGAARIAHKAEVVSRTGLGTVLAVFHGGFVVRLKPGAPAIGKIRKLAFPKSERIVSGSIGPIYTPSILSSSGFRLHVNSCGRGLLDRFLNRPTPGNFLSLSRRFAECLSLMTPRLRRLLILLDRQDIPSSMMMIGQAVFSMVQEDRAATLVRLMKSAGIAPLISKIQSKGARLL